MEKSVGFFIFRLGSTTEYLFLKSSKLHEWGLPKGHVEVNDTGELGTAFRETREETRLTPSDLTVIPNFRVSMTYPVKKGSKLKETIYFLAKLRNPDAPIVLSSEHSQYKWLDLSSALDHIKFKDLQDNLKKADIFIQELKQT